MIPFAVADLRLADRFELSSEQQDRLATWTEARHQLEDALRGFGGGSGWTFVVFLVLAAWGIAILLRRRPELVAWGLIAFAGPPLLSTLVRTGRAPDLSPRHLIFALPFFAAFVGVAVARTPGAAAAPCRARRRRGALDAGDPRPALDHLHGRAGRVSAPWPSQPAGCGRTWSPTTSSTRTHRSSWRPFPETGEARGLPRAQVQSLLAALDRVDYPAGDVFVAVPVGTTEGRGRSRNGQDFGSWLIIRDRRAHSPTAEAVLRAVDRSLAAGQAQLRPPVPAALAGWFELNRGGDLRIARPNSVRDVVLNRAMSVLIKGGRVITAADDYVGDVYVEGERVSLIGESLDVEADKVIDASGKYVLPGCVDPHTHLDMPFGGTTTIDDVESGQIAAAFGGTTCHVDFIIQPQGSSFADAFDDWQVEGERQAGDRHGLPHGGHRPPRGRLPRGARLAARPGHHVLQALHGLQGRAHGRRRDALQDAWRSPPRPARS